MQLTTVHPLWLILPCVLLGLGVAWLLYRKGRADIAPTMARWLFAIRALAVTVLAFLLLEPMVRFDQREVRKPVVVIAHDGSASLLAAGDTSYVRQRYPAALQALVNELSGTYEVRSFTYGDVVQDGLVHTQDDAFTDLSQLFRTVGDRIAGSELGAVIVDGDGITNRGRDPRLDAQRLGVPVHVIALGDTTVRPDLILKGVEHNSITYLGNAFPILARLQAHHLKGRRTQVQVLHAGKVVAQREVTITADPFISELPFELKADAAGPQRYTVRLVAVDGEVTRANNEQHFIVDVLDDRQRVLILGAAPHPDLGVIRQALNAVDGYGVELAYARDPEPDIRGVDLVVLHGLPSTAHPLSAFLARVSAANIPVLHVVAQGTDLPTLSKIQNTVGITGGRSAITDALPLVVPDYPLFTIEPELARAVERFPPLQVPFAQYTLGRSAQALMVQRIGMVRTEQPLVAFSQEGDRRCGVIVGEGIWRWRAADQRTNNDHSRSDKLIHRMVQFLALKVNKEPFRVTHEAVYSASAPVLFASELYNANLEPVNTPEVRMQITDSTGKELSYVFDRKGSAYALDAGRLAPGSYEWKARTTFNGKALIKTGVFHVQEPQLERNTTVADHAMLADLAALTKGTLVLPERMDALRPALEAQEGLVARSYVRSRFSDLIGLKTLFAVLLGLLGLEWFLRRRSGSY
jgi:hypothetical protein